MDEVLDMWMAIEINSGAQDGCYSLRRICYEVCGQLEERYPNTTWLAVCVPLDQRSKVIGNLPTDDLFHVNKLFDAPQRALQ